jgi:opacity protein-like surface antigen
MKSRLFSAVLCILALTLSAALAGAQEAAPDDPRADDPLEADAEAEPELTWDDYTVKAYAIQIFGGAFNGDRYLDLPIKSDRTQVEEGSDWVMGYDGNILTPDVLDYEIYDSPVKELENGYTLGVKVASYLTDNFHVDLSLTYSSSTARLTMVNLEDPENPVREELPTVDDVNVSVDDGVQIFRGAISGLYDLSTFDLWGISPYVGFGFGGVLVSYSALEDVGALFLVGTGGLKRHLFGSTSAFLQFDLTNFSMSRDELEYTKNVTFMDLTFGLSFFIDTVPADVRALHESEQVESRR